MLWLRSLSLSVAAVLLVCAVFAPLLSPADPYKTSHVPVGARPFEVQAHPLGTDKLGRDVLSRLVYGARNAVIVVMSTLVLSSAIGTILGAVAGFGGRAGHVVDRLLVGPTAAVAGLPTWGRVLLSAGLGNIVGIFFLSQIGPALGNVVLVLTLLSTPRVVLAVRNTVSGTSSLGVVESANGSWNVNSRSRMTAHIAITVIITGSLQCKSVLLLESCFTFLGVGIPPGVPTWSSMVSAGPWWSFCFPLASILATGTAFHLLGGWVREIWGPKVVLAAHRVG